MTSKSSQIEVEEEAQNRETSTEADTTISTISQESASNSSETIDNGSGAQENEESNSLFWSSVAKSTAKFKTRMRPCHGPRYNGINQRPRFAPGSPGFFRPEFTELFRSEEARRSRFSHGPHVTEVMPNQAPIWEYSGATNVIVPCALPTPHLTGWPTKTQLNEHIPGQYLSRMDKYVRKIDAGRESWVSEEEIPTSSVPETRSDDFPDFVSKPVFNSSGPLEEQSDFSLRSEANVDEVTILYQANTGLPSNTSTTVSPSAPGRKFGKFCRKRKLDEDLEVVRRFLNDEERSENFGGTDVLLTPLTQQKTALEQTISELKKRLNENFGTEKSLLSDFPELSGSETELSKKLDNLNLEQEGWIQLEFKVGECVCKASRLRCEANELRDELKKRTLSADCVVRLAAEKLQLARKLAIYKELVLTCSVETRFHENRDLDFVAEDLRLQILSLKRTSKSTTISNIGRVLGLNFHLRSLREMLSRLLPNESSLLSLRIVENEPEETLKLLENWLRLLLSEYTRMETDFEKSFRLVKEVKRIIDERDEKIQKLEGLLKVS